MQFSNTERVGRKKALDYFDVHFKHFPYDNLLPNEAVGTF